MEGRKAGKMGGGEPSSIFIFKIKLPLSDTVLLSCYARSVHCHFNGPLTLFIIPLTGDRKTCADPALKLSCIWNIKSTSNWDLMTCLSRYTTTSLNRDECEWEEQGIGVVCGSWLPLNHRPPLNPRKKQKGPLVVFWFMLGGGTCFYPSEAHLPNLLLTARVASIPGPVSSSCS